MTFYMTAGLVALAVSALAADTEPASVGNRAVVVEVDGVKFTNADLQKKNPASLFQARNTLFEAERKATEDFVTDYLLERQAKKENVTVPELLKLHVDNVAAKEPSEEALRVYYDNIDTAEPFESLRGKIIEAIRQRRATKLKTAYLQSLRNQANVAIHLAPPRVNIALETTPLRGGADALVKVIEYADYECPYCQQIQPALSKLEREYKGKIAFGFKDVPLPMHPNAQKAAEASHCAGVQGKYWEYHDLLFESKQYGMAALKEHAVALKLDSASFNTCLDSGSQADLIKTHVAEATGFALPGTPGFFVNGRFISGGVDYDTLRRIVDEELREASSRKSDSLASR